MITHGIIFAVPGFYIDIRISTCFLNGRLLTAEHVCLNFYRFTSLIISCTCQSLKIDELL